MKPVKKLTIDRGTPLASKAESSTEQSPFTKWLIGMVTVGIVIFGIAVGLFTFQTTPSQILTFSNSESPDLKNYRVYYDAPGNLTYQSPHTDVGKRNTVALTELKIGKEGTYQLGLTALDQMGNESSMTLLKGIIDVEKGDDGRLLFTYQS